MHRQRNQLLGMLVVIVLLGAGYLSVKYYQANQTEEVIAESYPVVELDADTVTGISLTNEEGSFHLVKEEEGWYCPEDMTIELDSVLVENMVQKAVSIHSENRIESVKDLAQYGLTEPKISVEIQTQQADLRFFIGDYHSSIYQYYICLEGEQTVYTVDSTLRTAFTGSLTDFQVTEATEESS